MIVSGPRWLFPNGNSRFGIECGSIRTRLINAEKSRLRLSETAHRVRVSIDWPGRFETISRLTLSGRRRINNNEWINAPDDAVITEPNRAGRTMVWPLRIGAEVSIRCFM